MKIFKITERNFIAAGQWRIHVKRVNPEQRYTLDLHNLRKSNSKVSSELIYNSLVAKPSSPGIEMSKCFLPGNFLFSQWYLIVSSIAQYVQCPFTNKINVSHTYIPCKLNKTYKSANIIIIFKVLSRMYKFSNSHQVAHKNPKLKLT